MTPLTEPDRTPPRPEHPRPNFMREPWVNLNGRWRFSFDPGNVGEQMRWYRILHPTVGGEVNFPGTSVSVQIEDPFGGEIVVPFPWESRLSGIGAADYKGAGWYQRVIEIPSEWAGEDRASGPRDAQGLPGVEDTGRGTTALGANVVWRRKPVLCFGAVDWHARVWVNGRFVGEHSGGYTPFELDLSRYVRPGQPATLTVRAWDACDADTPLGKQTENWYAHSGGIWQTVWLEGRPAAHISRLRITPHLERGSASFAVSVDAEARAAGAYRLSVVSADGSFPTVKQEITVGAGVAEHTVEVSVPEPRAWSPEDPHLYDCVVRLAPAGEAAGLADEVSTYFGLRSVSRGFWEGNPFEYVLLNEEPVYLRGALDQAFHPDGLHTYPSDEAIRADVQAAKDLGLNMLRCHIKINEPRYYYWADRLGVLVMYDFPSASIYTPAARANWEQTFREALERDYSHPSIFSWILFNETWGLEEHQTPASWQWVREMFELTKRLDPTRLVEDNSACLYDHVVTDLNTWHFYISDYDRARRHVERVVSQTREGSPFNYVGRHDHLEGADVHRQGTEPLLNSEYAGLGARGGDKDISYSFKFLTTELRRHAKICGYVYTELTDIEWEHNGLLNYDRSPKEFGYDAFVPGMSVADLNGAVFVGLDCPPCQTLAPGAVSAAPVFVSHWDRRPLENARLGWRVTAIDRFGHRCVLDEGHRRLELRRYGVTEAGVVEAQAPGEPCLLTVAVWVEDGEGAIRARNYVNVDVHDGRPTPAVERTEREYALRFQPGDFADCSWPTPMLGPKGQKFGAMGAGWVEYVIRAPEDLDAGAVRGLRLLFEGAARTAANRIGWRRVGQPSDRNYPQTEARKLPTTVRVLVNGLSLGAVHLPDDPADARGVLSAHTSENFEYASHGFLTTLEADAETAQRMLAAAEGDEIVVRFEVPRGVSTGGLNLYGARMGAFPVDPTLLIET